MARPTLNRLGLLLAGGPLVLSSLLALPAPVAAAGASQWISLDAPLSRPVGAIVSITATASSGLPVEITSATPGVCTLEGTTVTMIAAGSCDLDLTQPGDATWGPASKQHTITVGPEYNAVATVLHDGAERTDGWVAVGDELAVRISAPDTATTSCWLRFTTWGGWAMEGFGRIDESGACVQTLVVPMPSDLSARAGQDRYNLDVCVYVIWATFADSSSRVMATGDRLAPGGGHCNNGVNYYDDAELNLRLDTTGTPRPFASNPNLLSWNPWDWDPAYEPLEFNKNWHVSFPDWVASCDGPYLNGSWVTVYRLGDPASGCPDWDLRLAGVLPKQMPWGGGPGDWPVELVMTYTNDLGRTGRTIITQAVAYKPSDGVFQSSFPAVAPHDLATTRFVNVSDAWSPTFLYSGFTGAVACDLTVYYPGTNGWPEDHHFTSTVDAAEKRCQFELPAFSSVGEHHQYYVTATADNGQRATFGGSITVIEDAQAPKVNPPGDGDNGNGGNGGNGNGNTHLSATAGEGRGMSLELSVTAASTPATPSSPVTAPSAPAIKAADACSAVTLTTNLQGGGSLADAVADCDLPPGDYDVTARMVDASGKVLTDTVTINVPEPTIPAAIAEGPTGTADRFVNPSITFDQPVTAGTITVERQAGDTWTPVAGTTAVDGSRLVFHPTATLQPGTYRGTLTSAENEAGAAEPGLTWTWTARYAAPKVTAITPGAGATGIDRDANIRVTFKDLVTNVRAGTVRLLVTATGRQVAAAYTVRGNVVIVNPALRLGYRTRYTVVVTTGVTAPDGRHGTARTWSFTTGRL